MVLYNIYIIYLPQTWEGVRKERYESKMVFMESEKMEEDLEKTCDREKMNQENRIWMQHFPVEYWYRLHAHVEFVLPDPLVGLAR
jgi:hypothetical protein